MKRAMWHLDKLLHQQMCCFFLNVTVSSKEGAGPAPQGGWSLGAASMRKQTPAAAKSFALWGWPGTVPRSVSITPQQLSAGWPHGWHGGTSPVGPGAVPAQGCPPDRVGKGLTPHVAAFANRPGGLVGAETEPPQPPRHSKIWGPARQGTHRIRITPCSGVNGKCHQVPPVSAGSSHVIKT